MQLHNALWLSPMESVSDLGFRTLCYRHGAQMTFTEMIRASSLIQENKATLDLVDSFDPKIPTGIQLFVTKTDVLKKALAMIRERRERKDGCFSNLSLIDLNFGCPSPDIIRIGGGPALLKRTAKMKELLTILRRESPLPCGIKIRLGMNQREKEQKVYMRILQIANEVGLDYMIVHAKTAADGSQAPIDIHALREMVKASKIPIIGNGFVIDGQSAKKMFDVGCSGVMIARAAIGDPWVFERIQGYMEDKTEKAMPSQEDYEQAKKEYLSLATQAKQKFVQYHTNVFDLRIKGDVRYHAPSRIQRWI